MCLLLVAAAASLAVALEKPARSKARKAKLAVTIPSAQRLTPAAEAERNRTKRMGDNLLKPELSLTTEAAATMRAEWKSRWATEQDAMARMEIITEMPQLDDALTIRFLLDLLEHEEDSKVRQQIVLMLGFMRTTHFQMGEVTRVLAQQYRKSQDEEERARTVEVMSNLPHPEAARFIGVAFSGGTNEAEKLRVAAGLFKLAPRIAVEEGVIVEVTEWLRRQSAGASKPEIRLESARVLAAAGQDNKTFLAGLSAKESDAKVKKFLTLASQEFPTH